MTPQLPSATPRRRMTFMEENNKLPCPLLASVFFVAVLLAPLVSGCARARAKTVPEPPALDVPAPPARIVETNDIEATPPQPAALPPPQPEPARRPPPRPRPAPTRQERSSDPRAEAPKAEAPAAETPKPAEAPVTNLQTTPTGAEGDVERAIHATLARATSDLNRVDYRGLNRDARTQYDTAKRFVEQADEAVRTKNLVFARNLADKAAALAAQLAGR